MDADLTIARLAATQHGAEVRDGIPRTRPPATLLGLAAVVPPGALEGALDDALGRGLVSGAQLRRRLDAVAQCGRPGLSALRQLPAARLIATVLRARFSGTVRENGAKNQAAARATMAPR